MEFTPNILIFLIVGVISLIGLLLFMFGSSPNKAAGTSAAPKLSASGVLTPGYGQSGLSGNAAEPVVPNSRSTKDREREKSVRDRLIQAGLYKRNSKAWFLFSQIALAAVPFVIGFVAYGSALATLKVAMLLSAVTAIAGIVMPGLWLDYRKSHRQKMLRRSLPDALDVIIVCVEAGLSLNAAIIRVSRELKGAHPMLASEMTIVHREIQMGKSTGLALKHMAKRFDLEELRSLSTVIQQSERFGTSVTQALKVHAESLRERRMQLASARAQKAAVKLLFPTVVCIFPALLVVILGPAAYDVMELFARVNR